MRDGSDLKKKKGFFAKAIIDDLRRSVNLYDNIRNDWENNQNIRFDHTIELKESRKLYQKHEDHILQFSDLLHPAVQYHAQLQQSILESENTPLVPRTFRQAEASR